MSYNQIYDTKMNSLSRGSSLSRVVSFLLTPKSTLPQIMPAVSLLDSNYQTPSSCVRTIRTQSISHVSAIKQENSEDGFFKRIVKKYDLFKLSEIKVKASGCLLYEEVADKINYSEFFEEFNMSDTFYSWFLITELHVWMLMARLMAEDKDGKLARNTLVEAMWDDTQTRAKVLWSNDASGLKKNIIELYEQFNCSIIGYDEAINGDDKVLAGALWRRIFQLECNDPEKLEKLLHYVRKQTHYLDRLPKEEVILKHKIEWIPLKDF